MKKSMIDEDLHGKRREVINNARVIVDEILAGKKDVVQGSREVFYDVLDEYDFFAETEKYVYDTVGLDKAYGLLDACIELPEADNRWQKEKTNDQLLKEARAMLFEELKKWQSKTQYK